MKALYVHLPFCHHLCAYCDFLKVKYYLDFADSYLLELKKDIEKIKVQKMNSIYLGGGTPSALDYAQLRFLLSSLAPFQAKEFTIEVNPENCDTLKLEILKEFGVNRLSIGVQTFDDGLLAKLNRAHCKDDVLTLLEEAKQIGFKNISIDLIYGLPGQTLTSFLKDVKLALKLEIPHISLYALSIEKHTLFSLNKVKPRSEEMLAKMYHRARMLLLENGYLHYEISNFAKPNYLSQHNLTYWRMENYLALGAGAAGRKTKMRYQNGKNINKFIKGERQVITYPLDLEQLEFEYVMLNLRTSEGINFGKYQKKFKKDFRLTYQDVITRLTAYLEISKQTLAIKSEYMLVANQIIVSFIKGGS